MRPLNPAELLEQCDLAGEVEVLELGRDATGRAVARLQFTKIAKGRVRRAKGEWRKVALVRLRGSSRDENGTPILGSWSDYYQPGTAVFTHLIWDADLGAYETSWWNAVGPIDPNRKFARFPGWRGVLDRVMQRWSTS